MKNIILLFVLCLFSLNLPATHHYPSVEKILASDNEPDGIVFELLSWDENTWTWAAPLLKEYRKRLLAKFPDIDIAVVSHGGEQFQLTREEAANQPMAMQTLQTLSDEGVSLHVCGTHSSWKDVSEDSYIDIVDVSPSGPAQINDYIKLGYTKIVLSKPHK
ncbi:MAG: DsrE family protein [Gammaproteobacteria bacterium]|nr:DsrE family protein [Gammaproteobacteria bacterium]